MLLSDFDYELPPERIAREPARPRDASRMLLLERRSGAFSDSMFRNLPETLRPGDVLVFNDTRVIRARLYGRLRRTAGTERDMEVLFVNRLGDGMWEVMAKPGRRIRPGDRVIFEQGVAEGIFGAERDFGLRRLELDCASFDEYMERAGHIPLPPYLQREDGETDRTEYQTIFAQTPGAIAAPTAGLHFTPEILHRLGEREIETAAITLHVGIGTFLPVRDSDPQKHRLKPERFHIGAETADKLRNAKREGRRLIAVGTTATRTLEYVVREKGEIMPAEGEADLYILPGHDFRAIDGLLTNFHLPQSTLLMLVSAFSTRDYILAAYRHAIDASYRFYSYGDCMLLL